MLRIKESKWNDMQRKAIERYRFALDESKPMAYKYAGHDVPTVRELEMLGLDDDKSLMKFMDYLILYIVKDENNEYVFKPYAHEKENIKEVRAYLEKIFFDRQRVRIELEGGESKEEKEEMERMLAKFMAGTDN